MRKLLQLKTSLLSGLGQSGRLSDAFVAAWQIAHPGAEVVSRDFALDTVPHLDGAGFQAFLAEPGQRSPAHQARVACSDALIEELKAADPLVIGVPMYPHGIPPLLKSWFDHIRPCAQLPRIPRRHRCRVRPFGGPHHGVGKQAGRFACSPRRIGAHCCLRVDSCRPIDEEPSCPASRPSRRF